MTAREAICIIRDHISRYEKSGDQKSALELFSATEIIFQASQKEFRELPIDRKCEIWRERGIPEEIIKEARSNGANFGVGDDTARLRLEGAHTVTLISKNCATDPE